MYDFVFEIILYSGNRIKLEYYLALNLDGQRRSRCCLLNILYLYTFWKWHEKSLVALEPWHWPDSLFTDTVVITDTALTPAPWIRVSGPGAITVPGRTAACLYRKRKLHRTRGPPTHAIETTVVRAKTTECSRSERIRDIPSHEL